jgi:hypothetical protein
LLLKSERSHVDANDGFPGMHPRPTEGRSDFGGNPGQNRRVAMTTIKATCPDCGDVDLTPADVLVTVSREMGWSKYSFTCPNCSQCVSKPADEDVVQLLTSAGVRVKKLRIPDEYFDGLMVAETVARLTEDDILDFALWIEATEDVVTAFARAF